MSFMTKYSLTLVSATKFNISPQAIDDGSGVYGTIVNAGSGDWVLGSALPKGRKLLVVVNTGALTSTPTALKVCLLGGATDANGSAGAEVTGITTPSEWATPAGDSQYLAEIDLSGVTDLTKYYSLGLASNGGGSTSVFAGAVALVLDPVYSSA
jgi:hypothetical protein